MKMPRFQPFLQFVVLSLAATLLAGCAGFDQRWANAPKPTRAEPFAGRWDGKWTSEKHPGEGGRLRCVFSPMSANRYEAAFHANFRGVFAANYTVTVNATRRGNELDFEGTHALPSVFGGTYHFAGRVTPTTFVTNYDSSYDRGTFTLGRE